MRVTLIGLAVICAFARAVYCTPAPRTGRPPTAAEHSDSDPPFGTDCPECQRNFNVSVTEEELHALRVEYIKRKLLKKLDLTEAPVIPDATRVNLTAYPFFAKMNEMQGDEPPRTQEPPVTMILAGESVSGFPKCPKRHHRSVCVFFKLSTLKKFLKYRTLTSVRLMMWQNGTGKVSNRKQSFSVVGLVDKHGVNSRAHHLAATYHPLNSDEVMDIEIRLDKIKKHLFNKRNVNSKFYIQITSKGHGGSPVKTGPGEINMAFTFGDRKVARQRRATAPSCEPGTTGCCAETVTINFREIGWQFVRSPDVLTTKFCRGSCTLEGPGFDLSHVTVVRQLSLSERNRQVALSVCCSPTEIADVSFVFLREDPPAITHEVVKIKVTECGCEF